MAAALETRPSVGRRVSAAARIRPAALTAALGLSLAIAPLAAVAAAVGLFASDVYRDNDWVRPQLRGNDLVTLTVAVPLLAGALLWAWRGSLRGHLLWLGALGYMAYNYLYYAVGAAFNPLFLVYVAVTALSSYALVLGLVSLEWEVVARSFAAAPVSGVRIFFAAIGSGLGLMWTGVALAASLGGEVPQTVVDSGHPTAVVFALDLLLIAPLALLTAVGLRSRRTWAYVLAAVMLVKAATYGLALLAMTVFAYRAGSHVDWYLVPLWVAVAAGGNILSLRYFAAVRQRDRDRSMTA